MKLKSSENAFVNFPYAYVFLQMVIDDHLSQPDFMILDANPAFEKMFGLDKANLLNQRTSSLFTRDWASDFDWSGFLSDTARNGTPKEIVRFIKALDMDLKITVYSDEKGTLVAILQQFLPDGSDKKLFEMKNTELTILDKTFETIFNTTHDAMFIVEYADGEFHYQRNNITHQRLSGFSSNKIFGKTPVDLMGEDTGREIQANYQRCVDHKASITYEQILPFEPGASIWLTTLTPIFRDGSVRYIIGSGKDITDFITITEEKEVLFSRLESMFNEHSACMLLIHPKDGKILDVNPAACAYYGYSKEEFLKLYISDINTLPWQEADRLRRLAYEGRQDHFIMPHRLKSGEMRLVDVYSSPITYGSEKQLFSIIFDVTDRERFRENLYNEKELLHTTLLSIGDGVVTTDVNGKITNMNQASESITAWSASEAKNLPFTEIFKLRNEKTGEEVENPIKKVLDTGKLIGLANHTVIINKYGEAIPIADSAAPIRNEKGEIFGVVMVFRDVSLQKAQENKILYLSYHDALTGLYNRRYLENAIKQFVTTEKLPIAIVMGDVNGLKITNDVFGHKSGDRLLQKIAKILSQSCGPNGILARWGGDEFVMLLPNCSEEQVRKLLKQIRSDCEKYDENNIKLNVSLGYAIMTSSTEPFHHKLQEAEEHMYHTKLLEGKSYRNTIISALLATLSEKSLETEEHAQRMQLYCKAIGERLRLSENEMNDLSLLAILHDIGKVGVSQNILLKAGPLTKEEWKEMKKHPEIGYRITQTAPELSMVSEYVLTHHERWDGNGYPSGLKGERIPLLCRILAVVDAYDAMTNDRVYRKAIGKEEAIKALLENANTQFDPKIVEIFLTIINKGKDESKS